MTEKYIENYLINRIKELGGKAFKFSSPSNNGVPDRIVLYRGKCYFVELKRPNVKPRRLQKIVHEEFQKLGFKVYVIDSVEKVGDFISEISTS